MCVVLYSGTCFCFGVCVCRFLFWIMCIYMPVHRPVHLLHLVLCVCVSVPIQRPFQTHVFRNHAGKMAKKWEWTSNFEKGHTVLLLCVYASLRESSGTNTSHPVSLFFFFFVSSIQRNMAEMCNYLFEALCFQQVWNMCTSSPLLFPFIFVRLLFLNPPSSSCPFFSQFFLPALFITITRFSPCHTLFLSPSPHIPLVNFSRLFFFYFSHTPMFHPLL